jgi:transposase-like protein
MSPRYNAQSKAEILAQLRANFGDVARTSRQMGVPERTLYAWKRQLQQLQQQQSPLPQHYTADPNPSSVMASNTRLTTSDKSGTTVTPTYTSFTDEGEAFHYLRGRLLYELFKIVASLDDSYTLMPPHQRALLVSQLIDRLVKLDAYIPRVVPEALQIMWIEDGVFPEDNAAADLVHHMGWPDYGLTFKEAYGDMPVENIPAFDPNHLAGWLGEGEPWFETDQEYDEDVYDPASTLTLPSLDQDWDDQEDWDD